MKIICPICKEILEKHGNTYCCKNKHSFDIAKEGYLNLNLYNSNHTGDNEEMINQRHLFLHKDYYAFLKDELNNIIKSLNKNSLVDLACGEGYYTSSFEIKEKVGIDLSKKALKLASKNDKSTIYLLASIFKAPIDNSDIVVTIFAPVAKDEIKRILNHDGYFILVKPDINHLIELKEAIYDEVYLNEIEDIQVPDLKLIKEIKIKKKVLLDNESLKELFTMTPYYIKTSNKDKEKLTTIDKLAVSFEFIIDIYHKD